MRTRLRFMFVLSLCMTVTFTFAQKKENKSENASLIGKAVYVKNIPSLASMGTLIPAEPRTGEINPRRSTGNNVVPGKGSTGPDPLLEKQKVHAQTRQGRAPIISFEVNSSTSSPTDPTGAIGPNHYVSAKNSAFAIHNRAGGVLVASTSLSNIFPGETLGDPIVFYDSFEDRFVVTEFSNTPNGFLVAVCQGPDPVNDGWYTYRFNTSSFPDYTKFSVWSDGYYVTANKDQGAPQSNEVVFALERDLMLTGDPAAQIVGFNLPGVFTNGFYSPASLFATGQELPPPGEMTIIYMQDDAWTGVTEDKVKLWTVNVDWVSPGSSTIAESQELTVSGGDITAFDGTFDGGGFVNLPQPGTGVQIDALQALLNYPTNYRRFCDYNSMTFNFTIDVDPAGEDVAAVRWYELRQAGDGQPWTVYQEGTYNSPDGKSAWCASMAMDVYGNIGMAYTTVGTIADGATANSFPSLRYTGRLVDDPLGTMTVSEETIATGTGASISTRYGDYSQISIDPLDDQTFWYNGEYFSSTGQNARNVVAAFLIADGHANDAGVVSIDTPTDDALTASETVTITITNYGNNTLTSIPVSYSVDGGGAVNETWTGSLAAGATTQFVFAQTADLSSGNEFTIDAETNLVSDATPQNDCFGTTVRRILANDVGVVSIDSPNSGLLGAAEVIMVTIRNFGGSPQTNVPVSYTIDGGGAVNETFTGTVAPGTTESFSFAATADLSVLSQTYTIVASTNLVGDEDAGNDSTTKMVTNMANYCEPTSNCTFGDGATVFSLGSIVNHVATCGTGYNNSTSVMTDLDRAGGANVHNGNVQSGWDPEEISMWIDFNNDGDFDDTGEQVVNTLLLPVQDVDTPFVITIPTDAPLGAHVLRVRGWDPSFTAGGLLNNPCDNMTYGNTEDFTVNIIDSSLSIEDFVLDESELIIISKPDNKYEITLRTPYNGRMTFNLYNLLGQQLVFNNITKVSSTEYKYDLDMSYASSGVYLVKMGYGNVYSSAKIVVK